MGFHIVPFAEKHIEDAAALLASRYRHLHELVPALPSRCADASSILPLLCDLTKDAKGVAAIKQSQLAGFLIGQVLPSFRGKRSAYSPEWANATDLDNSREIYQRMYASLSSEWVADGCLTHLVTIFANDHDAVDAWFWEGFGLIAVDAMRDLSPCLGGCHRCRN